MKKIIWFIISAVLFFQTSLELKAQDSKAALAQEAANPIANLMSFPFQNNIDFGFGEFNRSRNVLNIQPVIPLMDGKLITRTIIPIIWMPNYDTEDKYKFKGLSDITFTAFYVPAAGALMWGVGPVLDIPSGGSNRGLGKWNIGPSVVVLSQSGEWTLGILANNVWSFAGDSDRPNVNKGLIQYFIVYQLGEGWYINSAPIITVDWEKESGQQWTVPFGLGAGKLSFVGKLPLNIQIGAFYNVVKPDIGPDWQFRIQAQVLLPTSLITGE